MASRFGGMLAQHMKQGGWTQTGLAAESGVHHTFISKLVAGERMPSKKNVVAIARAMGLPDDERDRLVKAAGFAVKTDQPEWLSELEAVVDHPDIPIPDRTMLLLGVQALTELGRSCLCKRGVEDGV